MRVKTVRCGDVELSRGDAVELADRCRAADVLAFPEALDRGDTSVPISVQPLAKDELVGVLDRWFEGVDRGSFSESLLALRDCLHDDLETGTAVSVKLP